MEYELGYRPAARRSAAAQRALHPRPVDQAEPVGAEAARAAPDRAGRGARPGRAGRRRAASASAAVDRALQLALLPELLGLGLEQIVQERRRKSRAGRRAAAPSAPRRRRSGRSPDGRSRRAGRAWRPAPRRAARRRRNRRRPAAAARRSARPAPLRRFQPRAGDIGVEPRAGAVVGLGPLRHGDVGDDQPLLGPAGCTGRSGSPPAWSTVASISTGRSTRCGPRKR